MSQLHHNSDRFLIRPGGTLSGRIGVPGDKSISHRSIMFGAIAEGVTEVEGFLDGEDSLGTLRAFSAMGADIRQLGPGRVRIQGRGPEALRAPATPLDLGNSGTSMRLMSGLLSGLGIDCTLIGDESLSRRPMARVVDPLRQMGARIDTAEGGRPPLKLYGNTPLQGMDYRSPLASAQVKSCVLLAGLHAEGLTRVVEPAVTRDHTERMLEGFGVKLEREGLSVALHGGQRLQGTPVTVPGDISSAAFFLCAAAMTPGSNLYIQGVGLNPTRTGVIEILRLMGAQITIDNERLSGGEPVGDLLVRGSILKGIDIPEHTVSLAIDEFPMLFIAAAAANGTTRLRGAEELRVKESDRIQVMIDGLAAFGVECEALTDGANITGGGLHGGTVASNGDHRIAMAFAMAGLVARQPIEVLDAGFVDTSFPGFADLAVRCGLQLERLPSEGAA